MVPQFLLDQFYKKSTTNFPHEKNHNSTTSFPQEEKFLVQKVLYKKHVLH